MMIDELGDDDDDDDDKEEDKNADDELDQCIDPVVSKQLNDISQRAVVAHPRHFLSIR